MPTEARIASSISAPARWLARDSLLAATVATLALALLILSGQQLLIQLSRIPANSVYRTHEARFTGSENSADYVRDTVARFQQMPPARRGALEWRRLATLQMLLPLPEDQPDSIATRQQQVFTALGQSLILDPAHPLSWAMLSALQAPPLGECASSLATLRQSYRVAPIDPDYLPYRLQIAIRCSADWDAPFTQTLRADLLTFYRYGRAARRKEVITLVQADPIAQDLIRQLLTHQPDARKRFEADIKRFGTPRKPP
jgi:hypothetical protein